MHALGISIIDLAFPACALLFSTDFRQPTIQLPHNGGCRTSLCCVNTVLESYSFLHTLLMKETLKSTCDVHIFLPLLILTSAKLL